MPTAEKPEPKQLPNFKRMGGGRNEKEHLLIPTQNKSWMLSNEKKRGSKEHVPPPPPQAHEEVTSPYEAEGGTEHGVDQAPISYKKTYVCNMHRDGFLAAKQRLDSSLGNNGFPFAAGSYWNVRFIKNIITLKTVLETAHPWGSIITLERVPGFFFPVWGIFLHLLMGR